MQRDISFSNVQTHLHSCSFTHLKIIWMQLIEEFCTNAMTFSFLWKTSERTHFEHLQGNHYYYEIPDLYAPMPDIMKAFQQIKWQERGYVQNLWDSSSNHHDIIQLILSMLEFRVENEEAERVQHELLVNHVLQLKVENAMMNELIAYGTTSIKHVL